MAPAGNGSRAQSGTIKVEGAVVVVTGEQSSSLSATVVNNGSAADQVVAVYIDRVPAALSGSDLVVAPGGFSQIGFGGANFADSTVALQPGTEVTIAFANASPVQFTAMVVAPTGIYAGISAQPAPSNS